MTKRTVALAVLVPLAVVGVAAAQPWLTGVSSDPVLGRATVTATGGQAAPAATALLLVVAAALVALLTGGPRVGVVAGGLVSLAGLGVAGLVAGVLAAPGDLLGRRAAELAGRTGGTVPVDARVTAWAYAALAAAVVLAASGIWAALAARRWSGLSARFELGGQGGTDPRARSVRRTDWDALSEGHDPTRGEDADPT